MGLAQYITGRVLAYLLVLFIGITITFFLPRMLPSDPIEGYIGQLQSQAGQTLTPEALQNLRDSLADLYGLKGSLFSQYLAHLKRVFLTFDFGPSLAAFPKPVKESILTALPWTVGLLMTTTISAWIIGNLVGLIAGFYHNRRTAKVMEVVGVVLYPIPYYILALVLILLFGYIWAIFPLSTTIRPGPLSLDRIANILYNSFLPGLTLVLAGFGWNILG